MQLATATFIPSVHRTGNGSTLLRGQNHGTYAEQRWLRDAYRNPHRNKGCDTKGWEKFHRQRAVRRIKFHGIGFTTPPARAQELISLHQDSLSRAPSWWPDTMCKSAKAGATDLDKSSSAMLSERNLVTQAKFRTMCPALHCSLPGSQSPHTDTLTRRTRKKSPQIEKKCSERPLPSSQTFLSKTLSSVILSYCKHS
jgi:hypothetical protein